MWKGWEKGVFRNVKKRWRNFCMLPYLDSASFLCTHIEVELAKMFSADRKHITSLNSLFNFEDVKLLVLYYV